MGSEAQHETRPGGRDASPLISARDLRAELGRPGVKIFDVRGRWGAPADRNAYDAGHLPGAVFLDWTREFVEQGVPIHLASVAGAEAAQASFRSLGIDADDEVVLYDDYHHMLAARMWWAMRCWGFARVRVLDGGWSHWVTEGLPTTTDSPASPRAGAYRVAPGQDALRIGLDDFIARKNDVCLFDARGARGYTGIPEDPRSGHIPGAISVPYSELLDPDTGRFRPVSEIEAILSRAVAGWREERVISSCGSGYAGSVLMLALAYVGKEAQLFDGSFSVWRQDPARPVVRLVS